MSLWSRLINVFRGDALSREIREEFEHHIAAAVAEGADADQVRRRFGHIRSRFEASRDIRLIPWLDSLRGDRHISLASTKEEQGHDSSCDFVHWTCHRSVYSCFSVGRCVTVSAVAGRSPRAPLHPEERGKTFLPRRYGLRSMGLSAFPANASVG
jgi:hypothetical protein